MVELGEHCHTHIIPRLKKVIDGEDRGGISEVVGWKGGGGFRYYRMAPSLLERDKWDNWVVSKDYNASMLAEAMCKHMGFTYAPSQAALEYWNHGYSSERDFIYVTTQALTYSMLRAISNDVGPERHLLICCKAFSGKVDEFENITVRRIPQAVLTTCEWGRNDYSFRIANLPSADGGDTDNGASAEAATSPSKRRRKARSSADPDLFKPSSKTEV